MTVSPENARSKESITEKSWVARSNSDADKTDKLPTNFGVNSTVWVWSVRLASQTSMSPSR